MQNSTDVPPSANIPTSVLQYYQQRGYQLSDPLTNNTPSGERRGPLPAMHYAYDAEGPPSSSTINDRPSNTRSQTSFPFPSHPLTLAPSSPTTAPQATMTPLPSTTTPKPTDPSPDPHSNMLAQLLSEVQRPLKEEIAKLTADRDTIVERMRTAAHTAHNDATKALRAQNAALHSQNESLRLDAAAKRAQFNHMIADTLTLRNSLTAEAQGLRDEVASLRSATASLTAARSTTAQELVEARRLHVDARQELLDTRQQLIDTRKALASTRTELANAQTAINDARATKDTFKNSVFPAVRQVFATNEALSAEVATGRVLAAEKELMRARILELWAALGELGIVCGEREPMQAEVQERLPRDAADLERALSTGTVEEASTLAKRAMEEVFREMKIVLQEYGRMKGEHGKMAIERDGQEGVRGCMHAGWDNLRSDYDKLRIDYDKLQRAYDEMRTELERRETVVKQEQDVEPLPRLMQECGVQSDAACEPPLYVVSQRAAVGPAGVDPDGEDIGDEIRQLRAALRTAEEQSAKWKEACVQGYTLRVRLAAEVQEMRQYQAGVRKDVGEAAEVHLTSPSSTPIQGAMPTLSLPVAGSSQASERSFRLLTTPSKTFSSILTPSRPPTSGLSGAPLIQSSAITATFATGTVPLTAIPAPPMFLGEGSPRRAGKPKCAVLVDGAGLASTPSRSRKRPRSDDDVHMSPWDRRDMSVQSQMHDMPMQSQTPAELERLTAKRRRVAESESPNPPQSVKPDVRLANGSDEGDAASSSAICGSDERRLHSVPPVSVKAEIAGDEEG